MDPRNPRGKPTGSAPRPAGKSTSPKPGAAKPAAAARPATKPVPAKPGDGLLGWFGRQVGHVSKAVQADVTKPGGRKRGGAKPGGTKPGHKPQAAARPRPAPAKPSAADAAASVQPPAAGPGEKVIYRHDEVEEAELPDRPGVILRRTIIDEVVVEAPPADQTDLGGRTAG